MTDRPQFDVLANMRPAPERQPSEAEALRAEVAALRQLVRRAFIIIETVDYCDWSEQTREWADAAERWIAATGPLARRRRLRPIRFASMGAGAKAKVSP